MPKGGDNENLRVLFSRCLQLRAPLRHLVVIYSNRINNNTSWINNNSHRIDNNAHRINNLCSFRRLVDSWFPQPRERPLLQGNTTSRGLVPRGLGWHLCPGHSWGPVPGVHLHDHHPHRGARTDVPAGDTRWQDHSPGDVQHSDQSRGR